MARRAEFACVSRGHVTAACPVEQSARCERSRGRWWELPGLDAVNFQLTGCSGGSRGTLSLRFDPHGKSYAPMLLTRRIQCSMLGI